MIKRDELKGPSCLTSAQDDEPIFVLRSSDELAPLVVRIWAMCYLRDKSAQPDGMTERQKAKHGEALDLARQMDVYRIGKLSERVTEMIPHPVEDVVRVHVDGRATPVFVPVERGRLERMLMVCKLASELCNALDAEDEDVGGHRPSGVILKELGPACDAYEGR